MPLHVGIGYEVFPVEGENVYRTRGDLWITQLITEY
jgi:hypothetical protein